jgi:hypothetical protein
MSLYDCRYVVPSHTERAREVAQEVARVLNAYGCEVAIGVGDNAALEPGLRSMGDEIVERTVRNARAARAEAAQQPARGESAPEVETSRELLRLTGAVRALEARIEQLEAKLPRATGDAFQNGEAP